MLFRHATLEGIRDGSVTQAFRRWDRPRVKLGTRLRTSIGIVEVEAVEEVDPDTITDDDARAAGVPDRVALIGDLDRRADGTVFRVRLRPGGPDPREALRARVELSDDDRAELVRRLARMDASSPTGPWTEVTLRAIAAHPGALAADLAHRLGRERDPFKRDVRKLKELGLTESLRTGYRLSPRGRAWLASLTG
jgi:hypothetical protein